ncbi:MAG: UDP-N-acetylmuramoyl-L-alanine--D-glutamate ligase [Clostridia bacterium]|nr:UDP-N-acetylmuramoyl-L-alanine--D-glutamate ligase [Clostridia bacterium]
MIDPVAQMKGAKVPEENKNFWQGKRVMVLGLARSGVAVAQLLCQNGAKVLLGDKKTKEQLGDSVKALEGLDCEWFVGQGPEAAMDSADMLLISPGVPIDAPVVKMAEEKGIPVTGELEVASQLCPGLQLALTGTNGKTTTVSLLGEIFRGAGKIAHVAGNIGYPLSSAAMESTEDDAVVVEVSSFQLETTEKFHPRVAAVLNLTPDHLNRHYTMENYGAVKRHIFDCQNENDVAVLNFDDAACRDMAEGLKAKIAYFSRKQELDEGAFVRDGQIVIRWKDEEKIVCPAKEVFIPGPHNLENALAAAMMAYAAGVPSPVIRHVLRTFKGVEHRIEPVRDLDGVRWYNDSKGTNVDSTIKAVETMTAPTVLILGGSDKGTPFDELAEVIVRSGFISHCVLCGATAGKIEEALKKAGYTAIHHTKDYEETVRLCRELAVEGGNVLLSPACASFDQFKDYEQRGRIFKELVNNLK